jgi:hypothetical protein
LLIIEGEQGDEVTALGGAPNRMNNDGRHIGLES